MFQDSIQDAGASTVYPVCDLAAGPLPEHHLEDVRHLLLGSLTAVQRTILKLHRKHYAEESAPSDGAAQGGDGDFDPVGAGGLGDWS